MAEAEPQISMDATQEGDVVADRMVEGSAVPDSEGTKSDDVNGAETVADSEPKPDDAPVAETNGMDETAAKNGDTSEEPKKDEEDVDKVSKPPTKVVSRIELDFQEYDKAVYASSWSEKWEFISNMETLTSEQKVHYLVSALSSRQRLKLVNKLSFPMSPDDIIGLEESIRHEVKEEASKKPVHEEGSIVCFHCNKKGHIARACPSKPSRPVGGGGCFSCGQIGHRAMDCPNKFRGGGYPSGGGGGYGGRGPRGPMTPQPPKRPYNPQWSQYY